MNDKMLLLSLREYEVLEHVAKGKINKEIANELNIKEGTVKQHLHSIYLKLNLKNRVTAASLFLNDQLSE